MGVGDVGEGVCVGGVGGGGALRGVSTATCMQIMQRWTHRLGGPPCVRRCCMRMFVVEVTFILSTAPLHGVYTGMSIYRHVG